MKKKLMFAFAAILAATSISLSSCSKDPVDKLVSIYEDGYEQLKGLEVHDKDKINKINKDVRTDAAKVYSKINEEELSAEQIDAIGEARAKFERAENAAYNGYKINF